MKQYSKAVASSATFAMSGLIHEYILFALCCLNCNSQTHAINSSGCSHFLGLNLAFFMYNGVLIVLESAFCGTLLHHYIVDLSLPTPLLTCIVIGAALPVAHWFTDSYVNCNIYASLKVGCPMVVMMK